MSSIHGDGPRLPSLTLMWILGIAAVLVAWFAWRVYRSPGRAYNGVVLLAAAGVTWLGLVIALETWGHVGIAQVLALSVFFLGPVAVLVATLWLVVNGVIVVRKEGLRVSTLLPLVFGVGSLVVVGLLVGLPYAIGDRVVPTWVSALTWLLFLLYAYVGFHLVAYTAYAVTYSKLTPIGGVDAVVVLGGGLSRGYTVTPLLISRLRRGLEVFEAAKEEGRSPVLVTSGGQGPDEQRSEAAAMAEWVVAQGVPSDEVLLEDRSRTTAENLAFSRELLAPRSPERVVVATSNYHVLRTASLVRKARLDWKVVGAPTASYYTPTAFLREFIAHLTYAWKWHAAIAGFIVMVILALWLISIQTPPM